MDYNVLLDRDFEINEFKFEEFRIDEFEAFFFTIKYADQKDCMTRNIEEILEVQMKVFNEDRQAVSDDFIQTLMKLAKFVEDGYKEIQRREGDSELLEDADSASIDYSWLRLEYNSDRRRLKRMSNKELFELFDLVGNEIKFRIEKASET